jgi:hypothetical protein
MLDFCFPCSDKIVREDALELLSMIGGETPSELYLSHLCERSFLSLWSYPNLFNDKGSGGGKGNGKELCDLLVVFGNDVIIFSDKSCEYKDSGRLAVDWNRWYRRAIEASVQQIYGAERWLRQYPGRIYLDKQCTVQFPLALPAPSEMRVHRVAVALGAKEPCKEFYGGGSGSLRISTDQDPNMASDHERMKAFTIGGHDKEDALVHVYDDTSLNIVLSELDTISDFVRYLRRKEDLFQKSVVSAAGEEELLGMYLRTLDDDGEHGFGPDASQHDFVAIPEGFWDDLQASYEYREKKDHDVVSYKWDQLIEYFNNQKQEGNLRENISIQSFERGLRLMASLNRVERRGISRQMVKIFSETKPNQPRFSAMLFGKNYEYAVFFVLLPPRSDRSYEEYLSVRRAIATAYADIVKYKHFSVTEAIGLATEPHMAGRGGSEDLIWVDLTEWSEDRACQAERDMAAFGLKMRAQHVREHEYPSESGG